MALTKTRAELAEAVLKKLVVIDITETAATEDSDAVIDAYDAKYDELVDQEIAYWSRDAIPNAIFAAVVNLIANEVRESYGEPMSAQAKEQEEIILLRPLRKHTQRRPSGHATEADYF